MPIYTLRCELATTCGLKETFAFFEDPYNLAKITPPSLSFQVTSKDRVIMRKGAEITYTIKWMGLPMHWKTLIRDYDPPRIFVDEQAKGPYTMWRHTHTFEDGPEGTRVGDQVEYKLPMGPFGAIAHAVMVKRQLLGIFRYRQERIGNLLSGRTHTTMAPVVSVKA